MWVMFFFGGANLKLIVRCREDVRPLGCVLDMLLVLEVILYAISLFGFGSYLDLVGEMEIRKYGVGEEWKLGLCVY